MATTIPNAMRRAVIERANGCCEYCGKPQISFFAHEIDHIIAEKHRGSTTLENLALACFECNRFKGSDIASLDPLADELTPLFNPRTQLWETHFRYEQGVIVPLTAEGRVTVDLLRLNDDSRVQERTALGIGMNEEFL
ncbi:MAG: HNH endonuclease [Caldilineaceae bacterium]|nr:HNH endonuclease [Caldilineaceae bacterium]MCB0128614.1 HNH endonuclease [Caldilineaceae bacterium]